MGKEEREFSLIHKFIKNHHLLVYLAYLRRNN